MRTARTCCRTRYDHADISTSISARHVARRRPAGGSGHGVRAGMAAAGRDGTEWGRPRRLACPGHEGRQADARRLPHPRRDPVGRIGDRRSLCLRAVAEAPPAKNPDTMSAPGEVHGPSAAVMIGRALPWPPAARSTDFDTKLGPLPGRYFVPFRGKGSRIPGTLGRGCVFSRRELTASRGFACRRLARKPLPVASCRPLSCRGRRS